MYSDKFSLSWSEFEKGASNAFRELLDEIEFVDVTLVSDDLKQIKAHKVILSACSSIFKKMLQQNPQQQPIIYLTGVAYKEMQSMVNFMYLGQTEVEQDDLNHFMEVAAKFDVKGLSQEKQNDEAIPVDQQNETVSTDMLRPGNEELEESESEEKDDEEQEKVSILQTFLALRVIWIFKLVRYWSSKCCLNTEKQHTGTVSSDPGFSSWGFLLWQFAVLC